MRFDCVLAAQLERLSAELAGAGTEQGDGATLGSGDLVIAVIGKAKTSPLMNADNTDRKKQGLSEEGKDRRNRRDRKGKGLPLITADNADRKRPRAKLHSRGRLCHTSVVNHRNKLCGTSLNGWETSPP
jgi:hypothetical protein